MDLSMKRFVSLAVAALIVGCGGGGADDTGGEAAKAALAMLKLRERFAG